MGVPTRGRAHESSPSSNHRTWSKFCSMSLARNYAGETQYSDDRSWPRRRDVSPYSRRHRSRSSSSSSARAEEYRVVHNSYYRNWSIRKVDWPSPCYHRPGPSQSPARKYGPGPTAGKFNHLKISTGPRRFYENGRFSTWSRHRRSTSESSFRGPAFKSGESEAYPSRVPYSSWASARRRAPPQPQRPRSRSISYSKESGECDDSRGGSSIMNDSPTRRDTSPSHSSHKYKSRSRSRSPVTVKCSGSTLFVVHLPTQATEKDLEEHFATVGKVLKCCIVFDSLKRMSRGFGFVSIASSEEAERCIKYLHRSRLRNGIITFKKGHPRSETPTSVKYLGKKTTENVSSSISRMTIN